MNRVALLLKLILAAATLGAITACRTASGNQDTDPPPQEQAFELSGPVMDYEGTGSELTVVIEKYDDETDTSEYFRTGSGEVQDGTLTISLDTPPDAALQSGGESGTLLTLDPPETRTATGTVCLDDASGNFAAHTRAPDDMDSDPQSGDADATLIYVDRDATMSFSFIAGGIDLEQGWNTIITGRHNGNLSVGPIDHMGWYFEPSGFGCG